MADIDIDPRQARTVAELHDDAAESIEDIASSLPEQPDAGMASDVIAAIVSHLVAEADRVAVVEQSTAGVMRQIANNVLTTEATVTSRFESLTETFP